MNLTLIISAVVAVLLAVLGIQRASIKKHKAEKSEALNLAKDAKKAIEVVLSHQEAEKAVTEQETALQGKIEGAEHEKVLDIADDIVNAFNKLPDDP